MTPEDEEFERISREIRRNAAEDDDIQDYKKSWVGLTDKDRYEFAAAQYSWEELLIAAETRLKEKNF
jgi:hypothetical protein